MRDHAYTAAERHAASGEDAAHRAARHELSFALLDEHLELPMESQEEVALTRIQLVAVRRIHTLCP